jgi:hypothetical protein
MTGGILFRLLPLLLVPHAALASEGYGNARGAGHTQTSEIFLGRVSVGVILPDTPGAFYSPHDAESVVNAVEGAMEFWAQEIGSIGVSFSYDVRSGVSCSRDFAVVQPRQQETAWVSEILGNMGYAGAGSADDRVYAYLNDLRVSLGTEWAICFFIPKVNAFNASYVSYSRIGGPYGVIPAGAELEGNRYVLGKRLTHLVIHETAHLFWAQNEHAPGQGEDAAPCSRRSGYFAAYNFNSLYQDHTCLGAPHEACSMEVPQAAVCVHTLAQMGLRNTDGDGIPDLLDTYPEVDLDPIPDTITTVLPVISGVAREVVPPNFAGDGSRNAITFNTIEHVVYRIDRMTDSLGYELWLRADPPGGWPDTLTLPFSFVPDSLTAGPHRIAVRAVNSAGNPSDYRGEQIRDIYVKAIAVRDFHAEPDYDGAVRLAFRVHGGTLGAQGRLFRRTEDGGETLLQSFMFQPNAQHALVDAGATPGERTMYRLEASAGDLTWDWETTLLGPSPVAPGRYLSTPTPNPFREYTVISYRVPRGSPIEEPVGGDGNEIPNPPGGSEAPSFVARAATRYEPERVEVDVFDLAGRLIRAFPHIHYREAFYPEPILWDGRNDAGERLPAGMYLVRMRAGRVHESRKIILLP